MIDQWKRGRAVEGTGLENQQGFAPFVSSNLTASANSACCDVLPDPWYRCLDGSMTTGFSC
jgi:hypothetical protein